MTLRRSPIIVGPIKPECRPLTSARAPRSLQRNCTSTSAVLRKPIACLTDQPIWTKELSHAKVDRKCLCPDFRIRHRILGGCPTAGNTNPPFEHSSASATDRPAGSSEDQGHLLHITSLRQGANGNNRQAPNAANYDESKANPYPDLPDPLVLKNGQKVATAEMWWNQRRPEIVEEFDREIYGRVPKETPKVNWEVTGTTNEKNGDVPVVIKKLVGHVDNSSYPQITVDIQLTLTTPANATGPVPVMMEFGFAGFGPRPAGAGVAKKAAGATTPPGKAAMKAGGSAFGRGGFGGTPWQQQVLAKGWGYAIITPNSIQADNGAGLTRGIIGLCNKGQPRKVDDWGALRAWAWGAVEPSTILRPTNPWTPSKLASRVTRPMARQPYRLSKQESLTNPTPEALVARWLYWDEYRQSADTPNGFHCKLHVFRKEICKFAVNEILRAVRRHKSLLPEDVRQKNA